MSPYHGSSLEDFLEDEGILEEVTKAALNLLFDDAEDEPRDDHGRWTTLGKAISSVIASDPKRLTHGNTEHHAFFIKRNGESVSWDKVKWGDTDLEGATSVHSHLPENYSDKIVETFSGGDLETFAKQAREFGITKHAVITSPSTMDVLEMSPKFISSKLSGAKLRKVGEASYEERTDYFNKNKNNHDMGKYANSSVPFFREKMRRVAPTIGIHYATDIPVNLQVTDASVIADSAPTRDPTGTGDIRRAFERELKDRWQRLDRCLNKAVGTADVLSLSPNGAMALISSADRTKQFRSWLDELLSHLIVSGGDWMKPYLDEAGERASSRAASLGPRKAVPPHGLPTAPRLAGHTTDAYDPDEPRNKEGEWTKGGDKPREFYRGENPGDTRRIATGETDWDSHLFMSSDPESAAMYGHTVTKYQAAPDAKILYEGTREWSKVAGLQRKGESLLSYAARAGAAAKAAGYHAAHFKRQGDVGTPIFDPSKFVAVGTRHYDAAIVDGHTTDTLLVLATSELQGICDAYAQQATRIAAHAALVRWRPSKAARAIRQLTASVGLARSRMMADYLIVKAHAASTLDAFREAGVRHVGTIAEVVPNTVLASQGLESNTELSDAARFATIGEFARWTKQVVADAARKTPQHRHPVHGRFITEVEATREWGRRGSGKFGKAPKTYNRSLKHRKALRGLENVGEEEVDVQTAGDDKVCHTCQAISAAGPYPIDDAMDLIPAHPNCRCVYVPASIDNTNQ